LDNIKSSETEVDLHKEISDLSKMKMEYDELIETKCSLLKSQKLHDVAAALLKDTGIKSKIIKQYLPTINAMINKYLADLNFYVSFHLDENFNEEIKSRNKESFSYGSFSEGQKMRIDLALLFTWREVAKMKNSVNTNLLFLDEIFDSSMDAAGTDEIMKLINAVSGASNIFLISHKTDQFFDKFDSVIQFEIKNNFTSMKYV
jgi:DNA repair exonuclease SbcCD ATPase subunit